WLQGDTALAAFPSRARNCTTRRTGVGRPRAVSTPHALITRRPCCPTARSSLQVVITTACSRARNCTIQRAGLGRPRAASTPRAVITRRPCCPTGWCWLQLGLIAVSRLPRARNCTTLVRPRQHQLLQLHLHLHLDLDLYRDLLLHRGHARLRCLAP